VDKPWIPCLTLDGRSQELSLADTFAKAHEIKEIMDPSPVVAASLHRLLLAIMHRVLGPKNESEWCDVWHGGEPDIKVDDLLDYLNCWKHRFNLFDQKWPFYQVADFTVKRPSPVTRLRQELASGNNYTLFDHSYEAAGTPMSPAEAARSLVATQNFALSGGRSDTIYTRDAPVARSAVILMRGDNLAQTLALNLIHYNHDSSINEPFVGTGKDLPAWEKNSPPIPGLRRPTGYVDLLTWQSRMVRLEPEELEGSLVVRRVHFAQAEAIETSQDDLIIDPLAAAVRHEKRGIVSLKFSPERAVWRDSTALMRMTAEDGGRCWPSKNVQWVSRMADSGYIPLETTYRLCVFGLETDSRKAAKVNLWRREDMPLPITYLTDPNLLDCLTEALIVAENVGHALRTTTWRLAKLILFPYCENLDDRKDIDKERVNAFADSFETLRDYWGALDVEFTMLLEDLVDNQDATLDAWAETCTNIAMTAFNRAVNGLEQDARSMRATTMVSGPFVGRLTRIVGSDAS
jgi:CRISPR system Cascade subunit CasA